jgi:hypothetical protein
VAEVVEEPVRVLESPLELHQVAVVRVLIILLLRQLLAQPIRVVVVAARHINFIAVEPTAAPASSSSKSPTHTLPHSLAA